MLRIEIEEQISVIEEHITELEQLASKKKYGMQQAALQGLLTYWRDRKLHYEQQLQHCEI